MPDVVRIPSLRLTEIDGSPDIQGVERIYLSPAGNLSNLGGGNALLSLSGSSSGGGISAVSALGAASAAGAASYLTTDNHLYLSDGSLWRSSDNPGWPRRDGADDEEWESANANPPTGWTWDNQNSTNDNENGTRKSFLVLDRSANAASHSVLYKNVPASPQKTYYAVFQWGSDLAGSGNNCQIGIAARNNTSGRLMLFVIAGNAVPTLFVSQWTTSSAFNAVSYTSTIIPPFVPGQYMVLAFTYDGTNLAFKYAPYYGGSEENLIAVYTEAVATFLTSFDSFGLTFFKNSGTTLALWCDWLRVL